MMLVIAHSFADGGAVQVIAPPFRVNFHDPCDLSSVKKTILLPCAPIQGCLAGLKWEESLSWWGANAKRSQVSYFFKGSILFHQLLSMKK